MRSNIFYLALCLLIAATAVRATIEFENGVAILTEDNFKEAIEKHDFVLVKFFAPWCGHCKQMKPKFIAAAELYQGEDAETQVMFADVDATQHGKLAGEYGVSGYPTLKFFIKGVPIEYNGGREEEEMVDWIEAKLLPSMKEVAKLSDLEEKMEENKVVALFNGEPDTAQGKLTELAAKNFDKVKFFWTKDEGIASEFQLDKNAFIILKQFDEGRNDFTGEFNSKNLAAFIEKHRFATVMSFDDEVASLIFGGSAKHPIALFLFVDDSEQSQAALKAVKASAKKLSKKMFFAYSTVDGDG